MIGNSGLDNTVLKKRPREGWWEKEKKAAMESAAKQSAARAAAPAPEVKGGQAFPRAPQEGVTWWDLFRAEMPDEEWAELSTSQKGNRSRCFPQQAGPG